MFETGKENLPASTTTPSVSGDVPVPSPSRKTPIRPLTSAYHAVSSDVEVLTTLISNYLLCKCFGLFYLFVYVKPNLCTVKTLYFMHTKGARLHSSTMLSNHSIILMNYQAKFENF